MTDGTDLGWRPIPEHPGYEAHPDGLVRSRKRSKPVVLVGGVARGYRYLTLLPGGQQVTRRVHYLVALTFIGPRPPGMQIRHLDGDRSNNALSNLAYGTASENARDMVAHGTHRCQQKTACAQGHAYTEDNTAWTPRGTRYCKTCNRLRALANYRASRARATGGA